MVHRFPGKLILKQKCARGKFTVGVGGACTHTLEAEGSSIGKCECHDAGGPHGKCWNLDGPLGLVLVFSRVGAETWYLLACTCPWIQATYFLIWDGTLEALLLMAIPRGGPRTKLSVTNTPLAGAVTASVSTVHGNWWDWARRDAGSNPAFAPLRLCGLGQAIRPAGSRFLHF